MIPRLPALANCLLCVVGGAEALGVLPTKIVPAPLQIGDPPGGNIMVQRFCTKTSGKTILLEKRFKKSIFVTSKNTVLYNMYDGFLEKFRKFF